MPHADVMTELIKECEEMRDSLDDFTAWNSGPNVTNATKVARLACGALLSFTYSPNVRPLIGQVVISARASADSIHDPAASLPQ